MSREKIAAHCICSFSSRSLALSGPSSHIASSLALSLLRRRPSVCKSLTGLPSLHLKVACEMKGNGSSNSRQTFEKLKFRGDRAFADFEETLVLLHENLATLRSLRQKYFEAHQL